MTSHTTPHIALTWRRLPQLPVEYSAIGTLCGQLVIIGGDLRKSELYRLVDGKWVKIVSMPCGRRWCLVVSPSPDKMMIVGGSALGRGGNVGVEECIVV